MASPSEGDYEVTLTDVAEAEQEASYLWLAGNLSPAAAARWQKDLGRALGTLAWSPRAGVLAPDNDAYHVEVHQYAFGRSQSRWRILYHVIDEDRIVRVLHIRSVGRGGQRETRMIRPFH